MAVLNTGAAVTSAADTVSPEPEAEYEQRPSSAAGLSSCPQDCQQALQKLQAAARVAGCEADSSAAHSAAALQLLSLCFVSQQQVHCQAAELSHRLPAPVADQSFGWAPLGRSPADLAPGWHLAYWHREQQSLSVYVLPGQVGPWLAPGRLLGCWEAGVQVLHTKLWLCLPMLLRHSVPG